MEELIMGLILKHPSAASVLVVVGLLRAIFKPLFAVVQAYVDATPDAKDNEKLAKFKEGKIYKAIAFILDYTASIKIPAKK